jgi:RNA polymerase sigma factor (sigma-70 family)
MNELINEIVKYHSKWVGYAIKIGCGSDSEDMVQEMYIKIIRFNPNDIVKNGKVQDGYIYIILKNTYLDFIKKESENLSDFDITKSEFNRYTNSDEYSDFFLWLQKEQETWKWSDKLLFDMFYQSEKSMRQIGRENNISFVAISRRLKYLRNKIKKYGTQNQIKME